METNIRKVSFSSSYTEHLYGFTQYDRGQKLKITGIETDANTEVHFALSASGGESPRVLPDSTGAETIVSVPDFVFCTDRLGDYEAYAFVCYSDVNVGKTERRIIMHIKSRPKPADFAPPSEPDLTQKVLQELSTKLTAPSSAQVGQIFRVQSINDDGTLTLEAVDMPSGGSGGGERDWVEIASGTVGENVKMFEFTDLENYNELLFTGEIGVSSISSGAIVAMDGGYCFTSINNTYFLHPSHNKQVAILMKYLTRRRLLFCKGATLLNSPYNQDWSAATIITLPDSVAGDRANRLEIKLSASDAVIPSGSTYALYGRS